MKHRVLAALRNSAAQQREPKRLLRPVLVGVLLVFVLSVAGAAVWRKLIVERGDTTVERQPPRSLPNTPAPPSTAPVVAPIIDAPPQGVRAPHHPRPTTVSVPAQAPIEAATDEPRPAAPAGVTPATRVPSVEESRLVMSGLQALRIEHDADHAAQLFHAYLIRYPDGVLLEECLAYAIEAESAREGDDLRALAEQYLRRFPNGRFRATADRAKNRAAR